MAQHRTLQPRTFTAEFRDWRQASAHGGQLAIAALLEPFGPKDRVARYRHAGRTEAFFDDPQIQVNGPSFEGAAMNYEGHLALSRQVLLVGPFVADQILGATSATKESPASKVGKDWGLTYHKAFYFDVAPLHALGWRAKYSNDEMFRESYDSFIRDYDRLKAEQAGSAHRKPVKEAILKVVKWFS